MPLTIPSIIDFLLDAIPQIIDTGIQLLTSLVSALENAEEVDRVLKQLDLSDLRDRHPMNLSGGQKQRVAIASAILAGKEILIFDEPTSGLDFRHMERTAELIASLKGKQTVLIVTHDPELIQQCCSHVLVIEAGKCQA